MPAVKSATLGSSPVISGISTRAPKATKSIWAPDSTWRQSGSLNSSVIDQFSFCLVPKILSPASPRPGMM
ncbi:hypothetical protein D3C79_970550 [compost metagenome]